LVPVISLLQLEKGLDLFQIGLAIAVYSATVMALELPTGGLADSTGRKRVYLYSLASQLVAITVLLFAQTNDHPGLCGFLHRRFPVQRHFNLAPCRDHESRDPKYETVDPVVLRVLDPADRSRGRLDLHGLYFESAIDIGCLVYRLGNPADIFGFLLVYPENKQSRCRIMNHG